MSEKSMSLKVCNSPGAALDSSRRPGHTGVVTHYFWLLCMNCGWQCKAGLAMRSSAMSLCERRTQDPLGEPLAELHGHPVHILQGSAPYLCIAPGLPTRNWPSLQNKSAKAIIYLQAVEKPADSKTRLPSVRVK